MLRFVRFSYGRVATILGVLLVIAAVWPHVPVISDWTLNQSYLYSVINMALAVVPAMMLYGQLERNSEGGYEESVAGRRGKVLRRRLPMWQVALYGLPSLPLGSVMVRMCLNRPIHLGMVSAGTASLIAGIWLAYAYPRAKQILQDQTGEPLQEGGT